MNAGEQGCPIERVDALFVGAEYEENLSIRSLTASIRSAGYLAAILPFNKEEDTEKVAAAVMRRSPYLVGLSMAFQHRAAEFLKLAKMLRDRGFGGHICAGGHFPTATCEDLLRFNPWVDSVLSHDAVESILLLMDRIDEKKRWAEVPGLALRSADGTIRLSPPSPAPRDLDAFPFPARDGNLHIHVQQGFTTLYGSLGCFGNCTFCAINSYCRSRHGPRLRFRSPESIAREMAYLYHEKKARIFCFHDDTFFLPSAKRTMARMGELADRLRRLGVGRIATVAKGRPDNVTPELIRFLQEKLGMMRLYLGVENFSPAGLKNLGRLMDRQTVERGLACCVDAGVYCCYNILLFEPDTVLDDVEENIRGIEMHIAIPFNFSRTEAYNGTAIWQRLRKEGRLRGNYLYTNYTVADPAVQTLFEIAAQAFKDRNFGIESLANMNSSLGYELQLLIHLLEGDRGGAAEIEEEARNLMTAINRDSLEGLGKALRFVKRGGWKNRRDVVNFTIDLAREINFRGVELQSRLLGVRQEILSRAKRR
jgi:anaerobic magnesium-protoporphyrin IX monomethyl ester cyclase